MRKWGQLSTSPLFVPSDIAFGTSPKLSPSVVALHASTTASLQIWCPRLAVPRRLTGSKTKGRGRHTKWYIINCPHTGKKRLLKKKNIGLKIKIGYGCQPSAIYAVGILCNYWRKSKRNINHLKISSNIKTIPQCPSFNGAPFWDSVTWWPKSIKNKVPNTPCLWIIWACSITVGDKMPPRWDLICLIYSSRFWRGNKYKPRI